MKYFGGIDVRWRDGNPYGDMMWTGVTERMKDSMCLLHYQLELPWEEALEERVKECRPVNYWTEEDRKQFYEKEPMMLAVHRAANAVLDLRLAKMRIDMAKRMKDQGASANWTFIGPGCLGEAS